MIGLDWCRETFEFPRTATPEWSAKVERWYQLDPAAFTLTETYWRHRPRLNSRPEVLFLASPLASNFTDAQFVRGASPSPAKFVHTLPNIRGASVLAVMEWSGHVYCLQNDPETLLTAISEGMHAVTSGVRETWILTVGEEDGKFTGNILRLRAAAEGSELKIEKSEPQNMANSSPHDKELFHWISEGGAPGTAWVGRDFSISRR